MALNIRLYYTLGGLAFISLVSGYSILYAATEDIEPVLACVIARDVALSPPDRQRLSQCLAWENDATMPTCRGAYAPITVSALTEADGVQIRADNVSFYAEGRSRVSGHVEIRQAEHIVTAQTAYVYRDAKKNQVTKIELLDDVKFIEPDRLMIARKATLNPQDKSGIVEDVLYRFNTTQKKVVSLTAWGRASFIERFANENLRLSRATYSTCPPEHEAWHIEAKEIKLDTAKSVGVAKHATLRVGQFPVMYSPYLTFPTSNARKSGFLMPLFGYTNIGGFDAALPYYWNIAPNYDAIITPHEYTLRGTMIGGKFRYLTNHSLGIFSGNILPQDRAFGKFLANNRQEFPQLNNVSTDRWSLFLRDTTMLAPNLTMGINFQQVSDSYYQQDFSSNLAILTENQLLRQGDLTYTTDHWLLRGMVQSYQTLHPVNQAPVANIYERLPQLLAQGSYYELPLGVNLNFLGQFDYYHFPSSEAPFNGATLPQGPRYHVNPIFSLPEMKPWGYITPSVSLVENYYNVYYGPQLDGQSFNRTIPQYSIDSGLTFERRIGSYTQTLEPRLFYLMVPYQNQTPVPVYDSAYMIFNTEQLFRTNRFSGFDRIGDANQLSYAVTSRWITDNSGREKASLSVGQISYFANRRVQLCYRQDGPCVDNPLMLGYLSPIASTSPIASHGVYRINSVLLTTADYVWDTFTHATNNGNLNFHYQPQENRLLTVGYTYLVDGNLLPSARGGVQNTALHQATVAYASPVTDRWSGLGIYSYNISKGYAMLSALGAQYENCCWAARLMGGRTFMSLDPNSFRPQYNNNVYFQVLLKGLGTVATSDPSSILRSYLPGLKDLFK